MPPTNVAPSSPVAGGVHPLSIQIRVHHLNDGENLESVLFRVQKGWIVQFKLGPTLFGRKVKVFTNYPENIEEGFKRLNYHELQWKSESINRGDDTAVYCEITFEIAGSFHYFFVHNESVEAEPNGSGFILVEPTLTYGPDDEVLPLDCILCQTYLAKCLGPFPKWEERLRTAKESGYNMVHITPTQELGGSLSSYSLRNQLKLNPMFYTPDKTYNFNDVSELVQKMQKEWKVLSITDVVLNHTANESDWLMEHPEATYNLQNSPHLRPAFLLDRALWYLSMDIAAGKFMNSGLPPVITEEKHLNSIRSVMYAVFLCSTKISELFMVDVEALAAEFKKRIKDEPIGACPFKEEELVIIQDPSYRRLGSTVDMNIALKLYASKCNKMNDADIQSCCMKFMDKLIQLNGNMRLVINGHLDAAMENVIRGVRYERLADHGPKLSSVSKAHPLVPQYFQQYGPDANLDADEELMYSDKSCFIMAHNGWVMGDNPLKNFAEPGSDVYLRRELIAWGDSVKLRYGLKPEDSPYLWEHMTKYVQQTAQVFYGLRLDNCHSTPIHVAEYLIDKAREVRPDLYVIAELFTSSEGIDNIFVNRLGITSLIREAMSAPDAHEEGRLVHRYGGTPVGAFVHPVVRPLTTGIAHAMFMDITHDNECPILRRSVYDLFPSAALVAMACCAAGSTWGYDQLVPHQINVVSENRHYLSWTNSDKLGDGYINSSSGIISGKRALNKLHMELGSGGYSQVFVDQKDGDTIAVTRHCPATHQSVILVARTSFSHSGNPLGSAYPPPVTIPGVIEEIILEGRLEHCSRETFISSKTYVNGYNEYRLILRENVQLYESDMVEITSAVDGGSHEIDFINFPKGSVIAFRVSLDSTARAAILKIRTCVSQFGYRMRSYSGHLIQRQGRDFESIISQLNLADLNYVLFRCDAEERAEGPNRGIYTIPYHGPLVYCGLQGIMSELMDIHLNNDLGHKLCDNLREGLWLPTYVTTRLTQRPSTKELGQWFANVFLNLSLVPHYLVPCYFDSIITGAYSSVLSSLWRKMSEFVHDGSTFVKALALGSAILGGIEHTSSLPILSPNLELPKPPVAVDEKGNEVQQCVTISAGLPHFSTGYMRNWGRDTFIALRGLFLITGRMHEARYIILAFAQCLRHGLIPNLLDRGVNSRFNCRDAIWWWLQSIQDYTTMFPDGWKILHDKVSRVYPTDNSSAQEAGKHDQLLTDVIHEALQKHFQGLKFRERNAGCRIDEHMRDNGFNNEIGVDLNTGFVFGGNADNCGTWMDKMGSSEKAGNKGHPATPRDGSAVEIVGLSMSALRWLNKMSEEGHHLHNKVEHQVAGDHTHEAKTIVLTYKEWADLIARNFQKYFWIDPDSKISSEKHINRRGIYKDSYGASTPWADFQLRPNFCISMVVAPELFTPEKAWVALGMAEKHLLGPLGMRTLDPSDWAYNGDYDNSDDSHDRNKAKGFNYHQGPEWLWPIGYFLRAKLYFAKAIGSDQELSKAISFTKHVISNHFTEIQRSKWKGLPELTNSNGKFCKDSCPIQAWSHACLLEVLYDLDRASLGYDVVDSST